LAACDRNLVGHSSHSQIYPAEFSDDTLKDDRLLDRDGAGFSSAMPRRGQARFRAASITRIKKPAVIGGH